jgi:hypothetical protein
LGLITRGGLRELLDADADDAGVDVGVGSLGASLGAAALVGVGVLGVGADVGAEVGAEVGAGVGVFLDFFLFSLEGRAGALAIEALEALAATTEADSLGPLAYMCICVYVYRVRCLEQEIVKSIYCIYNSIH